MDLTKPLSLEERLVLRIKESIGDIILEDDLREVVKRGSERLLFERRVEEQAGYYSNKPSVIHPSVADKIAKEVLGEKMEQEVRCYLKENPEIVREALDAALADGMVGVLRRVVSGLLDNSLYKFQSDIEDRLLGQARE